MNDVRRLTSRLSTCRIFLLAAGVLATSLLSSSSLQAAVFAPAASEEVASDYNFVGAWSGTSSYNVNDVVSYGGSLYINLVATAPVTTTTTSPGAGTNLFDPSAIADVQVVVEATGALAYAGGFQASGFVNVTGASSFVTNITMCISQPYGIAFYDTNRQYVSGSYGPGQTFISGGTPIPVPTGASFVRFWWLDGVMGTTLDAAIVNTGTQLQSTYTHYGSGGSGPTTTSTVPSAAPTDTTHWAVFTTTTAPTTPSTTVSGPWAGKKMFMLSDSIVWANPAVAGQIASLIGAVPSSKGATAPGIDAFPGRTFDGFENGQNGATYLPVSAAVLADVDLMVVALGTNQDSGAGLGSVTDAPSLSGSMSAQMRSMLETILSFKPGMRVIVVGPYQTNRYNLPAGTDGLLGQQDPAGGLANAQSLAVLKNINTAMKAVCQLYSIPYIDMYNESGVNFSNSALWLKDGLHPNTLGYSTFYAPYIASQLAHYAQ